MDAALFTLLMSRKYNQPVPADKRLNSDVIQLERKGTMQQHEYLLHMVNGEVKSIEAACFEQWRDKICFYPDEGLGEKVCEYPSMDWVFVEVKNEVKSADG